MDSKNGGVSDTPSASISSQTPDGLRYAPKFLLSSKGFGSSERTIETAEVGIFGL